MDEPLNESLQARLMLVLAASGQQASALSHYDQVRARLRDELGVDPGAEMRAAHGQVLRQEIPAPAAGDLADCAVEPQSAEPSPGSAEPPGSQAVSGPPPPRGPSPLVPPAQLPADLPAFAGREAELSQLSEMLDQASKLPRTVGICAVAGLAGIGKTTFAIHWAHRVANRFEDGQLYLNLRGFDQGDPAVAPTDALRTLLCSLGVPAADIPDDLDARAGLYRSILAGQRVLVVPDNAHDARQVRPLLPGSPGCLVLVTSRNPLAELAMAEGARLLTLSLLSFPAHGRGGPRAQARRRPGRRRADGGGGHHRTVRAAPARAGCRGRAGRRSSRCHPGLDRLRPPAHARQP